MATLNPGAPSRKPGLSKKTREALLAYGLLSPALLGLIFFTLIPVLIGFMISLANFRVIFREWVGFDNYARALAPDSEMWSSLGATITYSFISVPIQLGLSLLLAMVLYQKLRGRAIFRVVMFLPYITSTVASAAVWARLYSPDLGLINSIIKALGGQPLQWLLEDKGIFTLMARAANISLPEGLTGPSLSMVAVIIYTTWVFVGYDTTIFLGGLGNIPNEMYEAAKIDGAGSFQLFRHITLPLLSPTTFFLVLITIIGTFKAFNHIWVMTRGANGTNTAAILTYRQMYEFQRAGYASALAFLLFNLNIISSSASLIFAYALPHLVMSLYINSRMNGRFRYTFWGEIYETVMAFHLILPTIVTLLAPKRGKFNVTDKGGLLDVGFFDFNIVKPHLIVAILMIIGIGYGLVRAVFHNYFAIDPSVIALNVAWGSFSVLILLAAIAVAKETRQVRKTIRIDVAIPAIIHYANGISLRTTTIDMSMGGVQLVTPDVRYLDEEIEEVEIQLSSGAESFPVTQISGNKERIRLQFENLPLSKRRELVRVVLCRADAWIGEEYPPDNPFRSLLSIIRCVFELFYNTWKERRGKNTPAETTSKSEAV